MTGAPFWFERALAAPSSRDVAVVDGVPIHYEVWGERSSPGLVLVHGSNAHLEWWRFVAPFLADRFRVAALDSSGNGDSGWREQYTGESFAREAMAVARHAQLAPRPFLVGHSFGGFVALEAGHRHGADVGGIVLVDFTVASPEAHFEWGLRAVREGKKRRTTRVYESLDEALARFRLLPDQPVRHAPVMDHIARHSVRAVEGGWTWKFDPTLFDHLEMGADQARKFARLTCRSALILGEASEDEGVLGAPYMSEISGGKLPVIAIPGVHHHLMFEEPVALAMALKGILLDWVREDGQGEMRAALADALDAAG